ncbi:hypothetical protein T265_07442 [Opisthorchis viverrini]|uniref:Uncharacterized protein n=1 Tax=Opisthorchis viverrini TaxID=6198 RepID=A0A074ZCZ3_OPIVI|nr:hypothetical protein T265_07442 [Opisthorchis viverrini]KER25053.1 hypothetical protein T265_07442 [Opisthorchis viverrini]
MNSSSSQTDSFHANDYRSAVIPYRCLAAMLPKRSTRIRILPRCPSLDGGSQDREVIVKLWIFRLVNSRSNH